MADARIFPLQFDDLFAVIIINNLERDALFAVDEFGDAFMLGCPTDRVQRTEVTEDQTLFTGCHRKGSQRTTDQIDCG